MVFLLWAMPIHLARIKIGKLLLNSVKTKTITIKINYHLLPTILKMTKFRHVKQNRTSSYQNLKINHNITTKNLKKNKIIQLIKVN